MNKAFQILLALVGLCLTMISTATDEQTYKAALDIPLATKGESCVEPVEVMRRDHMNMLFHQRDKTMYLGERNTKHSLIGCLSCHTQHDEEDKYIPINAPGQFCAECHSYTAVKMDCFSCHATKPAHNEANSN